MKPKQSPRHTMARTPKSSKNSLLTLNPSFFSHLLAISPFSCPKKTSRNPNLFFFLFIFILFTFLGFSFLTLYPISQHSAECSASAHSSSSSPFPQITLSAITSVFDSDRADEGSRSVLIPLPLHKVADGGNVSANEREFWKQPDGEGYKPCLDFSLEYRKSSSWISKQRRKFLVVVVSGGLNQQRNQIVDAVVMARILEAALVVPVLQVNRVWGDESEFSDLFDVENFKKTLAADVHIVSSLPSSHLVSKQTVENQIPSNISPTWMRAKFLHILDEEGLLILKGIDSRLSKNLPSDLQKLRCKVAFHALRFSSPIRDLGNQMARRMWIEGPYIALHLRVEKDVWARTGCLTGLGEEYDNIIAKERESSPEILTDKLNLTQSARRLAGLCPLTALEVARLLKALGAPRNARLYVAGGDPFGGSLALKPLLEFFPNIVTKNMLAKEGELTPYMNRPSVLAAIDYIVSLSSDVFLPSHGGNMGRAMQGHRAYVGHRKYIKPNKRMLLPLLEYESMPEEELSRSMQKLHKHSKGGPEMRDRKWDRDVLAYPVPECMCKE